VADQWYYVREGQEVGPVTSRQLKELAASGALRVADRVRREGMSCTVPAAKVKNLFPPGQATWYFRQDGQELGPVASRQLKQLAASGKLQPTGLVRKNDTSSWIPASNIKGLFASRSSEEVLSSTQKPVAGEAAAEVASSGEGDREEQCLVPEVVPSVDERKQRSAHGLPSTCERCGAPLRQILVGRKPIKILCVKCHPPNGTCPKCQAGLFPPDAEYCISCDASWQYAVGDPILALSKEVQGTPKQEETTAAGEVDAKADELPFACERCGVPLRQVFVKREPTTTLCVECNPSNGTCPMCGATLRTQTAQQCMHCGASWHRRVREEAASRSLATPRSKCTKCGARLRQIVVSRGPTGETVCVSCNPIHSTCPKCQAALFPPDAEYCISCDASWQYHVGDPLPADVVRQKSPSETADSEKESLGEKVAGGVAELIIEGILNSL